MLNEFRETLQPIISDMFAVDIYFITRFCEIARFVNSLLVAIPGEFIYDVSLRYMVSYIANIFNVIFTIIHNFQ